MYENNWTFFFSGGVFGCFFMIGFGWGFLGSSLWLFLTFGLRVGLGVGVKGILRSWGFRISVVSN
jgi:hypothetical protein